MGVHPVLGCGLEKMELECLQIVDAIKSNKSKVTIFEINSSSKTPASEVMRAKRSKDTRLVDKFSKQREDRAAESRLQQPINPTTTADCDITEKEESDLNENNVKACLPLDFTQEQYDTEDRQLVVALSVTLGLFAIELAGFFSGVSMFNCSQGLLSLSAHCSASVSLSFFVFEKWECWTYWVIFATCSVLPALVEILLFIAVFGLKKKPL
ncbi:transmembrane protein 107 like isoform X2 [Oreochromis niloticus]|uniref:transmembrane protein 107 like isoform X2 n=1 Tax=Oreochromis niloticus TaxID=8128 RepID=UPI000DF48A64|nr:transmembrane protein 107 isoform X2 [Oreochromis niloticus]